MGLAEALRSLPYTFNAGLVRREDPGVSAGRGADVEVELNVVL